MLHKKGDFSDPTNFGPIALLNSSTKSFTSIINIRLRKKFELHNTHIIQESQSGFRLLRGTGDNIFSLTSIIQFHLRLQLHLRYFYRI